MSEADEATLPDSRGQAARENLPDIGERYELGPVLGRGGMGEVRIARDKRIRRDVAVKLLRTSARDDETIGRFFREARVQGVLEHPAVVPVHDLGIDPNGNPYFVMKKLAGITLADAVTARWPRRTLLARLVDICLAVELAHTRGVIHRDLKPANLVLGDFGEAYVLDWGLARVAGDDHAFREVGALPHDDLAGGDVAPTRSGDLLGTPGYMSPEQARGEVVDARTDVFSLGCVLFEILAGSPALPRGIDALAATLDLVECRPSRRAADVPPELDDLCARATAADRAQRPTARELANGIQGYLDGDRDLAQRRALAAEHAGRARAMLEQPGDDARATAMSEAGRALALDQSNALAQQLLGSLLLHVPSTIPAEALAAADEERGLTRMHVMRRAAWGYLVIPPILMILQLTPIHYRWPLWLATGLSVAMFAIAYATSRRPLPMTSPVMLVFLGGNSLLVLASGILFGPLLVMPFFMVGSLSAFLSQPARQPWWLVVAIQLAPLAILLGLETAGLVPPSFHVEHHTLVLTPWVVDVNATSFAALWAIAFAFQIASTIDVQGQFRRANETAQNQIHATAWHLQQLLPRGGADRSGRSA